MIKRIYKYNGGKLSREEKECAGVKEGLADRRGLEQWPGGRKEPATRPCGEETEQWEPRGGLPKSRTEGRGHKPVQKGAESWLVFNKEFY